MAKPQTVKEKLAKYQRLVDEGRGEEVVGPAFFAPGAARERVANTKKNTRFIFETDSPAAYSRLNAAKDRWIAVIGNKTVAVDALIDYLEKPTDEELREFAKGNYDETTR